MIRFHRSLIVVLAIPLLASLAGCTRVGRSGNVDSIKLGTATPQGTPAAEDAPVDLKTLDTIPARPLYVLNVTLDYAEGTLHAQQRVEFKNPTGAAIDELKFTVPPARRAGAVVFRDARIYGQSQPLKFALEDTTLTVQLPASLPADKAIALNFDFDVKIPLQEVVTGIGGDDTSRSAANLTAGHWYIVLPPFRDGSWDLPKYVPVGDPYTSELSDFEVSILAPEDVVVAGGGDETRDGRLWRYSLQKARVFSFSASDTYKVDSIEQDGVTYVHYTYPKHQQYTEAVLYTAARAVKLYATLYGPYPYKTLRIAETGRSQGQEYSGLITIGTTLYDGYIGRGSRHNLIATTAHETCHQWWFNVVGNDQVRTPWLDESFARMCELKFYREYYPNDADWWFNVYIMHDGGPKGSIDLSIYDYPDSSKYAEAIYRRGLLFLNDVRKLMGNDNFDAAMKDYYEQENYKITSQDAFFDAVARHSTEDLTPLVKAYFANPVTLPCSISLSAPGCRK